MLMNIWVRDKSTGYVHQVGTDKHDSLELIDGKVEYRNFQNGESTCPGSDYEFFTPPDPDDYVCVSPDELYLNKELLHKDLMKKLEEEGRVK